MLYFFFRFFWFYWWKARRKVRFHSFTICSKLHIFVYNKLTKWSRLDVTHIFETYVLYLGSANQKSLFHVIAVLLEVWISFWHNKLAMPVLAFVCMICIKFFKHIYQGRHISVRRMILSTKFLKRRSFIGVYQEF